MPVQTLVTILGGAVVLIVFSVLLTAYLLNRSSEHKISSATKPGKHPTAPATTTPSPVIIAPAVIAPKTELVETTTNAPASGETTTVTNQSLPETRTPALKESSPAPTAVNSAQREPPPNSAPVTVTEIKPSEIPRLQSAAPVTARSDPRIQIFVDSVRVAGIRFSGSESKVLMNDRVYRVNDVIDRSLNIRLQQVAPDYLTFVDANGVTYVKNF